MKLHAYIGDTGACSRREAQRWIKAGRVTVDGRTADIGTAFTEASDIRVDGIPLGPRRPYVYVMLNKPVGIVCTTAAHVEGNIAGFLKHPERLSPVGRLDKESEGLILLTNHGELSHRLLHGDREHEKEYEVTVDKPVTPELLAGMAAGVPMLGTVTKPCRTRAVGERMFRIVLTQGLNRQIRRMCKAFGYRVERLRRVRILGLELGDLPSGAWRELTAAEREALLQPLGLLAP
ncbi:pseudouridine synthase [Gordoniibacillus kamchatkensis]|uniref:Pseudouridine synthase n=1 Tax=Gordoniibacillus kamchatkensis TaxID=1590651 RepID=A0ABR5AFF9_9BACL|nr:pseudouridine synthase [Paenibacillus sp. VKM B-2647]KIL39102.1 pseudouridine synthase [Paenibacillus sp. VKM B-2647]